METVIKIQGLDKCDFMDIMVDKYNMYSEPAFALYDHLKEEAALIGEPFDVDIIGPSYKQCLEIEELHLDSNFGLLIKKTCGNDWEKVVKALKGDHGHRYVSDVVIVRDCHGEPYGIVYKEREDY